MKIIILIPIYNDWQSAEKLLQNIDKVISNFKLQFSTIIVNDASTEKHSLNLSIFILKV